MYVGLSYINGIYFHPIPIAHNLLHGLCKTFYCLLLGGENLDLRYDGPVSVELFEEF